MTRKSINANKSRKKYMYCTYVRFYFSTAVRPFKPALEEQDYEVEVKVKVDHAHLQVHHRANPNLVPPEQVRGVTISSNVRETLR